MNELKHSIGDYVVVSDVMNRRGRTHVTWVSCHCVKPRLGQIVGLAVRYNGRIEHECEWEDPSYFVPEQTLTFWQVKFGLINKPVLVREDGLRLANLEEIEELPKLYQQRVSWNEQSKNDLSKDSQEWPRDKKGRWL